MSLFILNKKRKKCYVCNYTNKIKFFSIQNLPVSTINNYFYKKNKKYYVSNFNTDFCPNCKNIQISKPIKFDYLYSNFKNKQKGTNLLYIAIRDKLKTTKKPFVVNIGKNYEKLDSKILKKINYIKFDPTNKKKSIYEKKLSSDFKNFKNFNKKVDLIVFDHFISNIPNIDNLLKILNKILKDDGEIVISTHYGISNLRNVDLNRFYFEHINYFSLKSLLILFKKFDLYLKNFVLIENDNFIKLKFKKSQQFLGKKVREVLEKENDIGPKNLFDFKKTYKSNKLVLRKLFKNKKERIYGYGASIGSITQIIAYNLQGKIESIIDDKPLDNTVVIGKNKIQIKKLKNIKFKNNKKIILNFIPRHQLQIKKKLKKYLVKGDTYINMINKIKIKEI